jgi:hypothetical protein
MIYLHILPLGHDTGIGPLMAFFAKKCEPGLEIHDASPYIITRQQPGMCNCPPI